MTAATAPLAARLRELRDRADRDHAAGEAHHHQPGRHTLDIEELGLRVTLTRARYPNRPEGVEQYAVTISRVALDHAPAEAEVAAVLDGAFGDLAAQAVGRPGGSLVRMFRLPMG